ncbi:MAG: efflux RND transporter periplasmic adaptor subunit [Alphaproteobacteria bacterium]|nr:MAG: efflux RND transporter periplasmic adaptor subunit [Alphaproteobacteria bacterium]
MNKRTILPRWKLPYIAVLGSVFALASVLGRSEPEAKTPQVAPPQAEYKQSIAGIGVIEPKSELVSIGVELSGVVRNVMVQVGDVVKKGDVLFRLDERDIDAQIETLEKSLISAKIQAADAAAQYATVTGLDDMRAVAKDEVNRRRYAKELATSRIEEIKAQLNHARTTKARLSVRAPMDGEVLEVNVRPGEFASAGALPQPLIRMGDVSTVHVRVEIDEEYASHIDEHSKAQAMRRGNSEERLPLTFVRFEPYIKPKQNLAVANQSVDTRVMQVIYALPQGSVKMYIGQQMDVFIDHNEAGMP